LFALQVFKRDHRDEEVVVADGHSAGPAILEIDTGNGLEDLDPQRGYAHTHHSIRFSQQTGGCFGKREFANCRYHTGLVIPVGCDPDIHVGSIAYVTEGIDCIAADKEESCLMGHGVTSRIL
jgi:hypothetical protein